MRKTAGFTLIEVIVTLVIVGILASVAGMALLSAARGYVFAKSNSALSEKAQLAMSRMSRTFIEVLNITTVGTSPGRVTYDRLIGGVQTTETLYLDSATSSIKIVAGVNPSGGDTLVDNVSSLTFTFKQGTSTWVPGNDFDLLSAVAVNLILNRPDGGTVTFGTVVSPRNNGNRGGEPPPNMSNINPSTCFIATSAFGDADHPAVKVLREFRDRFLLTSGYGRMFVRQYYKYGPYLADLIRNKYWVCLLVQALLLPLIATALLALHVPATVLIFTLLVCLAAVFARVFGGRRKYVLRRSGQNGALLLGLIATIMILGVLGAAMLSLTTSSSFSQISSNFSTRAYYLAEGGMRYTASQFHSASGEAAKDTVLQTLHNSDLTLSTDGTFHLDIYPYYFRTISDPNGTATLQTRFPGGAPSGMSIPTSGYIKLGSEATPRQYSGRSISGWNVTFTMASPVPSTVVNTNVLLVGVASTAQTLNLTNDTLSLSSGGGFFPDLNGTFTVGTSTSTQGADPTVYSYKNRIGNVLYKVRKSQDPTGNFSLAVPANAYITSQKFVNLKTSGNYASGTSLATTRTISYSIPIGWVSAAGSSGSKTTFQDQFDDPALPNWTQAIGSAGVESNAATDYSNALHITGYTTYTLFSGGLELRTDRQSLISFNWAATGLNLHTIWQSAGNFLSYDVQTKMKFYPPLSDPYYMEGLIFRLTTDGSCRSYGASFIRGDTGWHWVGINPTDNDRIPDDLCPVNHTPMIVLWEQTSCSDVRWLAYKTLSSVDGVIASDGKSLADWSTILVRVTEAASLGFDRGNGSTPLYKDIVRGANSNATARINGTPILASGSWGSNATGVLTVDQISGTFQNNENLQISGNTVARYRSSTSRTKDNYIRVYYGHNSGNLGTGPNTLAMDSNRSPNQRIIVTGDLLWPVDDITSWGTSANTDNFTLVTWNGTQNCTLITTGSEANAIIRTNTLITPGSGTFTSPEVGLDTWGTYVTSVYFDDFGMQALGPGQTQGFLPGIQQ